MSSEPQDTIVAEGVGKCYELFERPSHRLRQLLWPHGRRLGHDLWAVRDVSFRVGRGEVLGIVGRNGAGKSTLLQMVCGTVRPTVGRLHVNGRISALLELGAGFDPELTGIENVHISAALAGLSRAQVEDKLDDILAFADIGEFVTQPVKTYSSGMFVRLAFAVATSTEPQVLVIDEALSVGDGSFARKSFDRVMALKDQGASILFCSHSMYHVHALCDRALWLDGGKVREYGPAAAVTASYETALVADGALVVASVGAISDVAAEAAKTDAQARDGAERSVPAGEDARILAIESWTDDGQRGPELSVHSGRTNVHLRIRFSSSPQRPAPSLAFGIASLAGQTVTSGVSVASGVEFSRDASGQGEALLTLPGLPLLRGDFTISVLLACERGLHLYELVERAVTLRVSQSGLEQGLFAVAQVWASPVKGEATGPASSSRRALA